MELDTLTLILHVCTTTTTITRCAHLFYEFRKTSLEFLKIDVAIAVIVENAGFGGTWAAPIASLMIENWYMPPENTSAECQLSKAAGTHIVYSGNLGDRIDWDLFNRLASSFEDVVIHIVGSAQRSQEKLLSVLEHKNIVYHGPKTEIETLNLLKMMNKQWQMMSQKIKAY